MKTTALPLLPDLPLCVEATFKVLLKKVFDGRMFDGACEAFGGDEFFRVGNEEFRSDLDGDDDRE